ncbi:MAG TPA: RNA polymerase sigma factor [Gaiellaceae bacterium]|jgi:RNA polymerase sigma-70 factor (ECF subfamily)|nr:RNA polymerase sigma factor [Gaiellaceae bacterium]
MATSAAALEELYRARFGVFRDGLAGVVSSREMARDVVQEAFARALRDRRKFRGDGSLEAWVWRIALHQAFKVRRELRVCWDEDAEPFALADVPRDDEVRAAVRALPPRRRLIVFLRYFADLQYDEIARVCGVSEGTVAATLSQSHNELVKHLEPEGGRP